MPVPLKDTLTLPKTQFPMRGNLPKREPERFAHWDSMNLYGKTLEKPNPQGDFILHDGPPYANGDIHMGHALNKILKDLVIRFRSMQGHRAPFIPGWDCHGLPIEQQILRKVGDKLHDMEPIALRKLCHEYASEWISTQRDQFKRLGILGDWDKPYTTVNPQYEVGILKVLLALTEKGLIQKGHKAVHWDPVFRTALAEAEIEYHRHRSPSIYVAIPLADPSSIDLLKEFEEVDMVIWTTTPWTMPANSGVSLHPEFEYAIVDCNGRKLILAAELVENFLSECELEGTVLKKFQATGLDRAETLHPVFDDRRGLVMLGEHVTLEQGTGCVHTAPGHGADDFTIGKQYGLPVFCPVNDKGCYTDEVPPFAGQFVFDANPKVVEFLREKGILLGFRMIEHDYPYSWRSKKPIIFRATEQWFMVLNEGGVRDNALKAIDESVEWIPEWGRDRIRAMVERRPEWCISRQRHWGVPIPAIRSKATGKSILDPQVIQNFIASVSERGTNAWYEDSLEEFLPKDWNADEFEKEFDILDVWFDSGASHVAVLEQDERVHSPADLYLEGSDQHRGWFQHALLTGIGARDKAPFKAVLTHGFVLDGEGKAMSKSVGNVISPLDLIAQFGSDILRLWVASTDYRNDVGISKEIVRVTADAYRTIRNTFRFQIGNLYDFDAQGDVVPLDALFPLDAWALNEMHKLIDAVSRAFEAYEFHRGFQAINRFYTVTLSAIYHDILKDRLYTWAANSKGRRSAQTVIHQHLQILMRMLAPVLVSTCDEAFAYACRDIDTIDDSVHLKEWPSPAQYPLLQSAGPRQIESALAIRDSVNEKLEQLRKDKIIGKSIEAAIRISGPAADPAMQALKALEEHLAELFIVSGVQLEEVGHDSIQISARKAHGETCPRCWRVVDALVHKNASSTCGRCAQAL